MDVTADEVTTVDELTVGANRRPVQSEACVAECQVDPASWQTADAAAADRSGWWPTGGEVHSQVAVL